VVQGRRPSQANTLPPKSHSKKLERRQDRRQPWAKRSVRSPRSKPNRSKVTQGPSTTTRSAWTPRRACLARKQRGGAQSKQATRCSISLTRTWFSLTPLQASWRLWLGFYFILAWQWRPLEIPRAARPRTGRQKDLSGSAGSEVPSWA
jgi:hypothetical protein